MKSLTMSHQMREKSKLVEKMKADLYPATVIRMEIRLRMMLEECKVNSSMISPPTLYFLMMSLSFWNIRRMQKMVGNP